MIDPVREVYEMYKEEVEEEDGSIIVMYLPIFQKIGRGMCFLSHYPLFEQHDRMSDDADTRDDISSFRIVRNL